MENTFKTLAFFDLETTGLPHLEFNKTKITQLSIVACSRDHLINIENIHHTPRVIHKLNLCFNPCKLIKLDAMKITGLSNELLENESKFDDKTADLIINFLAHLQQPVLLIAHNGNRFDFKILKKHLNSVNKSLPDFVWCCDSLDIFRKVDKIVVEKNAKNTVNEIELSKVDAIVVEENGTSLINETKLSSWEKIYNEESEILYIEALLENYDPDSDNDAYSDKSISQLEEMILKSDSSEEENNKKVVDEDDLKARQILNETTPIKPIKQEQINPRTKSPEFNEKGKRPLSSVSRELFPQNSSTAKEKWPKGKYTLREIYKRYFNEFPDNSHDAEADVIALMKCVIACKELFLNVAETMKRNFSDVKELGM